jgi:glycosyltransferase involved in cell wall biosynthesis
MPKTVVVVPCYNEARRLRGDVFVEAARRDSNLEFLFVDDGSSDDTLRVLRATESKQPAQLSVLVLDRNSGKAEAVRRGMLAAFAKSPELVGYFDADLATPLSEIAGMRALFEDPEIHIVMGSRVALLGRDVRRSHQRHFLGRVFATAASIALMLTVYDTQCGAKLLRNTEVVWDVFREPFSATWTFDVEILERLLAKADEGRVPPLTRSAAEYPLRHWHDVAGSKVRLSQFPRIGSELIELGIRRRLARFR